jgi:hypothetical protein
MPEGRFDRFPYSEARFRICKVRYRGLMKNREWLLAAFALVNIY